MDTTNEPVAWMVEDDEDISFIMNGKGFSKPDASWKRVTPVYTHPSEHDLGVAEAIGFDKGYKAATAKTLTDEEIEEVWTEITCQELNVPYSFARAILRKAQGD
jgi:hypothetical protein